MGSAVNGGGGGCHSEDEESEATPKTPRFPFHSGLSLCTKPFYDKTVNRDTVIIFDWDDTLMCSSAIKGASQMPPEEDLKALSLAVSQVLLKAVGLGRTAIVTNANLNWVRASASSVLPSVLPVLEFIQILSARQSYEKRWPGDYDKWKTEAFRDVVAQRSDGLHGMMGLHEIMQEWDTDDDDEAPDDVPEMGFSRPLQSMSLSCMFNEFEILSGDVNLVVLGDSMVEMRAGSALGSIHAWGGNSTLVKTVKFKALPTIPEMLSQLNIVTQHLQSLVEADQNLQKKLVQGRGPENGWLIKDQ